MSHTHDDAVANQNPVIVNSGPLFDVVAVQNKQGSYDLKIADKPAEPARVLDKVYVDAGHVARALGVPRSVIVEDVKRGMAGALDAFSGQAMNGICVVEAWDLTEERMALHRNRLASHASGGVS
jgi:hypothetical protein